MGSSKIYLLSNVLVGIIPFILIPILSKHLTPTEYGYIAMFQFAFLAFNSVVGGGGHSASARYYFDLECDNERAIFNTGALYIYLLSILIIGTVYLFTYEYLSQLLSVSSLLLTIALTCSAFNYLFQFRLSQFQIRQQALKYMFFQLSYALLALFLTVFFILETAMPFWGRIISISTAVLCLGLASLYSLIQSKLVVLSPLNSLYIKKCLSFGLPLVPHAVSGVILSTIERPIITNVVGLESAGLYLIALQLSTAIYVVSDALNKAYVPMLYRILSDQLPSELRMVKRYSLLFILLLIIASFLAISIGEPVFLFIVDERYSAVSNVFVLLCVGQIITACYMLLSPYLSFYKKTKNLAALTVSSCTIHIILLLYFLPKYGVVGAGYSFICAKMYLLITTSLSVIITINKRKGII